MPQADQLVHELADLTALRDQELLDFSLLKTVESFLLPRALQLLKLDGKGRPCLEIRYTNRQCHVAYDAIRYSADVEMAIEQLGMASDGEFVLQRNDELLLAYPLHMTRSTRGYLLINTEAAPSKQQSQLMTGALQIYRNFSELLRESQSDQLTGLANRKTFDADIHKIFKLLPREHDEYPNERREPPAETVWLAIADIDNFKSINDRFGHIYGDEVLLLISQIIKASFRERDIPFRFGGEEFVVLMRCPNREVCATVLERFRHNVEQRHFPQVGRVTISIGVTQMQREIYATTLLDYADKALYHSKQTGKNRITFFDDLVATGQLAQPELPSGDITLF